MKGTENKHFVEGGGSVKSEDSNPRPSLTVRRELVSFKHSDTEDILLQVLNKKLTVGIPLRIQRVLKKRSQV